MNLFWALIGGLILSPFPFARVVQFSAETGLFAQEKNWKKPNLTYTNLT